MRVAVGSDHRGFQTVSALVQHLKADGHDVEMLGDCGGSMCDYPDVAYLVSRAVADGQADRGILMCGTGIGMCIAANKVKGIRCGVCADSYSARMIRQHNDANMLSLGVRIVGEGIALDIVDAFLTAEFECGRHAPRVEMIRALEG